MLHSPLILGCDSNRPTQIITSTIFRSVRSVVFCIFVALSYQAHLAYSEQLKPVQGESQYNVLRHSVAVGNSASVYGKFGSTLLGRKVVSSRQVWSQIDDLTKTIYESPENLDFYIADVATDGDPRSITLNAGFSCLDLGGSNSLPVSWWVSEDLEPVSSPGPGVGGFNKLPHGTEGSFNDILVKCLKGRQFEPNRRLVEHLDQHRGTGVKMIRPSGKVDKPRSLVGDNSAFPRLQSIRDKHDPSDVVVYDEVSGIGVVVGLPFDSGFRIHALDNMTTEKTIDFRVPMTPYAAITRHVGARLRETRVDRGESRTSNLLLLFSVWASGLALLVAVGILCKTYTDTLIEQSEDLRRKDVRSAVEGTGRWSTGDRASLFVHFAAVTILLAPVGQAIVEGHIDPRAAVEVHYGASVFYTDSKPEYSEDPNNPIAGAVFFVTSWITVRQLDEGFTKALVFSIAVMGLLAIIIAMRVTKRGSEMMRNNSQSRGGFSLWHAIGYARMWLRSTRGSDVKNYRVFVRLRTDSYPLENGECLEEQVKEVCLLTSEKWRECANALYAKEKVRDLNDTIRKAARGPAHERLRRLEGTNCFGLFARVSLDDERRLKLATARTTWWQDNLPREWEYVRRGASCESLEWYRTNGEFPPDLCLVLVQLGLLKYAQFIAQVIVAEDFDRCDYDTDGVRCLLAVPSRSDVDGLIGGSVDNPVGVPIFTELGENAQKARMFEENMTSRTIDVNWPGGYGGQDCVSYPASSETLRYFILESWHLSLVGEGR